VRPSPAAGECGQVARDGSGERPPVRLQGQVAHQVGARLQLPAEDDLQVGVEREPFLARALVGERADAHPGCDAAVVLVDAVGEASAFPATGHPYLPPPYCFFASSSWNSIL
jgi:hypothetical protein